MAEVYDDFDKRQEHEKRFGALPTRKDAPQYSAPSKGRIDGSPHRTVSELQRGLADALLDVTSARRR